MLVNVKINTLLWILHSSEERQAVNIEIKYTECKKVVSAYE